jgi:hypothetical protein
LKKKAFVNIDPQTLEVTFADARGAGLSIPASPKNRPTELPPIWDAVYFRVLYAEQYKRDRVALAAERKEGIYQADLLAPPPLWFVTIASIMWEGVLQGAAWDFVKIAVSKACSLFSEAGLGPPQGSKEINIYFRTGLESYAKNGRKQYGLYLTVKNVVNNLPEGHAQAYARAKDAAQFGRLVRGEEKSVAPARRPKRKVAKR